MSREPVGHQPVIARQHKYRCRSTAAASNPRLRFGPHHHLFGRPLIQPKGRFEFAHGSMHRDGAGPTQAALVIPFQPGLDARDMIFRRVFKCLQGQFYGLVVKVFALVVVHFSIVGIRDAIGNSYFPSVFRIHGRTVVRSWKPRNIEINRLSRCLP